MSQGDLIPSLAMMTLIAGVVIGAIMLFMFLRKRSNRHPMDTPAGRAAEDMRRREAEEERAAEHRPDIS